MILIRHRHAGIRTAIPADAGTTVSGLQHVAVTPVALAPVYPECS